MKKKLIDVQFLPDCKLYVVCVDNAEDIEIFASKNDIPVPEDKLDIDGMFAKNGRVFHIIFHKDTSYGDIAHEVVHFLNTSYLSIGQELDPVNDEMFCHQVPYFVDECIKFQVEYVS